MFDYEENLVYLFKVANIKSFDEKLIIKIINSFEKLYNLEGLTRPTYLFTPSRGLEGYITKKAIQMYSFLNEENFIKTFPLKTKIIDEENLTKNTYSYYIFSHDNEIEIQKYDRHGDYLFEKKIFKI